MNVLKAQSCLWGRVRPHLLGATRAIGDLLESSTASRACALYYGCLSQSNLGDEAVLDQARRCLPHLRLTATGTTSYLEKNVIRTYLARHCATIVGGGTLLLGNESLLTAMEKSLESGSPVATFGTGVIDPCYWNYPEPGLAARWRNALNACQMVGVRGPISKQILDDLGVQGVCCVGDPAVLLQHDRCPLSDEKILGVNFGTSSGNVWGGDEGRPAAELVSALAHLRRAGWRIRFFCVWPRDLPVIRRIAQELGPPQTDIVEEYHDAARFTVEASACRLFVGMKLHAVILAICAGVPTLALEYRPKLRDFMASISAESEIVRFDVVYAHTLTRAISDIADRADDVALRQWEATRGLCNTFRAYSNSLNRLVSGWTCSPADLPNSVSA